MADREQRIANAPWAAASIAVDYRMRIARARIRVTQAHIAHHNHIPHASVSDLLIEAIAELTLDTPEPSELT